MKSVARVLFALCCCAVMINAEDKKPAMQQGMPEMGVPKEMAAMTGMAGKWSMDMKFKMSPTDTAWTKSTGDVEWTSMLGGAMMQMHCTSQMMGMPFEGLGCWNYDRETKMWQSSWIDNMSARTEYSTGNTDKDGKIVMRGESMMMGQKFQVRQTTTIVSPTKHEWMYEMSNDGGKTWMTMMMATYTKK